MLVPIGTSVNEIALIGLSPREISILRSLLNGLWITWIAIATNQRDQCRPGVY